VPKPPMSSATPVAPATEPFIILFISGSPQIGDRPAGGPH
jgi:hypothetical protein